ncbi:hypothetical protein G3T36_01940 [Diaminobutyricibacter tongyongensis]|uniref:Antitoxin FitA-like ribbon-helix-helix domain-containing protein n=2 Tax=Leifsonia tongyongensis TaxID=1268043 RepID=A0A6L9XU67_9MICO|nr:hypothetical protein [Diaminobutyricibacter tongyongensis]
MGVTVQVRDLDPDVDERLKAAAVAKGISYSEYLRRELTRIAEGLRIDDRWAALQARNRVRRAAAPQQPFEPTDIDSDTIVAWIREDRDRR